MYKQGEAGRGLKNSDLALSEGSIAKRRGVKVMMMMVMMEMMMRSGGRGGIAKANQNGHHQGH
jgi:hypothetical protein